IFVGYSDSAEPALRERLLLFPLGQGLAGEAPDRRKNPEQGSRRRQGHRTREPPKQGLRYRRKEQEWWRRDRQVHPLKGQQSGGSSDVAAIPKGEPLGLG